MRRCLVTCLAATLAACGSSPHYVSVAMVAVDDTIDCTEIVPCFGPFTWSVWTDDPETGREPMDPPIALDLPGWPAGRSAFLQTVASTGGDQQAHWVQAFMDNDRDGLPGPGDIESTPSIVEISVTECTTRRGAVVDCNALPDWVILDHVIDGS